VHPLLCRCRHNLYAVTSNQEAIRDWARVMNDSTGNLPHMHQGALRPTSLRVRRRCDRALSASASRRCCALVGHSVWARRSIPFAHAAGPALARSHRPFILGEVIMTIVPSATI